MPKYKVGGMLSVETYYTGVVEAKSKKEAMELAQGLGEDIDDFKCCCDFENCIINEVERIK